MQNPDELQDARKKLGRQLDRLQRAIERLRIDYQRFLAGDLHIPPVELQRQIENELRRVRADSAKGVAENFRLNSLEAKLNSYLELYGRRIRQAEEGEARRRAAAGANLAPEKGVVLGGGDDGEAVKALYRGLHGSKQAPSMDIDRFKSVLSRQVEAIRSKTGCAEIQFRVASEGGKLKLKAKPIRD